MVVSARSCARVRPGRAGDGRIRRSEVVTRAGGTRVVRCGGLCGVVGEGLVEQLGAHRSHGLSEDDPPVSGVARAEPLGECAQCGVVVKVGGGAGVAAGVRGAVEDRVGRHPADRAAMAGDGPEGALVVGYAADHGRSPLR